MPRALDLNRLTITHDPVERIDTAHAKLPGFEFDLTGIVDTFLDTLQDLTGIDLHFLWDLFSPLLEAFEGIFGDLLSFNIPGAILHLVELLSDFLGMGLGALRSILDNVAAMFGIDLEALADEAFSLIDTIGTFVESIIDSIIDTISTVTGLDLHWVADLFEGLSDTGTLIGQFVDAITGMGPSGTFDDLTAWAGEIPLVGPFIELLVGAGSGLAGMGGLGSIFGDLFGILGNPSGLGSGSPILGFADDIPILGPLIGGLISTFVGGGSGLSGIGGFGDIIGDLLGILGSPLDLGSGSPLIGLAGDIPLLGPLIQMFLDFVDTVTGGLLGGDLGGFFDIFTDVFGLLGDPTGLGTGSALLPGLSSIPLLGGLFDIGTTLLGSLIPGLDASKITSGFFGTGTGGPLGGLFSIGGSILTSLIPGLDVSKIISGVFGSGLIPGLDASKITSGTFGMSMITGLLSAFTGIDLGAAQPIAGFVNSAINSVMSLIGAIQNAFGATVSAIVSPGAASATAGATAAAATAGAVTATVVNTYNAYAHATQNIGSSLNGFIRQFLGW